MNGLADIVNQENRLMISGDLNFSSVPHVWQKSLPLLASQSTFDFDLSAVTSVSSAGLALLIEWLKYARKQHKTCRFFHVPQQLLSIAEAAGIANLIRE